MEQNYFLELNKINVNDKTEKKNGLTYLSWAWAWGEFKKIVPDAIYEIKKFKNDMTGQVLPYIYDENLGYMVFTSVTANDLTHEMWLPVMDGANKSMLSSPYTYKTKYGEKTVEAATMFDINKTIMRCLTKNLAMFGLGLYIYAGEDLPETETETKKQATKKPELATEKQIAELIDLVQDTDAVAAYFKKATIEDLTKVEIQSIINRKKAQNETPKV